MSRLRFETVAMWGIVIGVVGALPATGAYLGMLPGLTGIEWALMGIGQVAGLCGGLGYAALLGVVARNVRGNLVGWRWAVAAIGKGSLSCYLLQSVIFAPLLSGWGFGLGATISASRAYALAVGVWLLSAIIAVWLEQRGKRGPAEKLLRRLTYGLIRNPRSMELSAQE